jgi:membrane protease YdiL (CAAX protease family)
VAQARQRRADGWQDYAGPSPFLATAAMLSLGTALQLPLLKVLASSSTLTIDGAAATLLGMLISLAAYVGLVHFLVVRGGTMTWRDVARPARLAPDPFDPPPQAQVEYWGGAAAFPQPSRLPLDLVLGAALVIPAILATGLLVRALMLILGLSESDITSPLPTAYSIDDRWLIFLVVAILAPIGEEIFFRGFATNAWGRSLGRASAILRAGLFFAFIHVIDVGGGSADLILRASIVAFAARVPVSFGLTWLYVSRRSIYSSAALHACYNGAILLIAWA